jgi:hypothetical protein
MTFLIGILFGSLSAFLAYWRSRLPAALARFRDASRSYQRLRFDLRELGSGWNTSPTSKAWWQTHVEMGRG